MMKNNCFVALILTHGRPDNVHTVKTLRKCGYTGDIIIVLDNEDLNYGLIEILLQEYSFVMRERNKTTDEDGEVEGRDYEWIELPSFDNPNEKIRMKRYYDINGKVKR